MARKKCTIAPASADPQDNSPLCGLPNELRNRIWELALFLQPDSDGKVQTSVQKRDQNKHSVLRLLETCRLIHNDTVAMFYDMHHLKVGQRPHYAADENHATRQTSMELGLQRLRQLSEPRLSGLRRITVDIRGYGWMRRLALVFKQLPRTPRLETITIIFRPGETAGAARGDNDEDMKRELPFTKRNLGRFPQVKQLKFELASDVRQPIRASFEGSYTQKASLEIEQAMPYAKAARAAKATSLAVPAVDME